jgi:hypothetical protein
MIEGARCLPCPSRYWLRSRYRWPRDGFSRAFHSHTQDVASTMDGFTIGIDLAGFKINRLVADRTIYLWLTGTCHFSSSLGLTGANTKTLTQVVINVCRMGYR